MNEKIELLRNNFEKSITESYNLIDNKVDMFKPKIRQVYC